MSILKIKDAIEQNKIPLSHIAGIKVYYSKLSAYFSICFFSGMLVLMMFALSRSNDPAMPWYLLIASLLLLLGVANSIGYIILKNPVFILEGERFYYLETNRWYNVHSHHFEQRSIGKHRYFCMTDQAGKILIQENVNFLRSTEAIENQIKWIKLPEQKKDEVRYRRERRRRMLGRS